MATTPKNKSSNRKAFIVFGVFMVVLYIAMSPVREAKTEEDARVSRLTPEQKSAEAKAQQIAASTPTWKPLGGNMWTGVKVFTGDKKAFAFEILGGNDKCKFMDGSGVMVRYPNGKAEWKNRSALRNDEIYYVKSDDPSIEKHEWYEIKGC